MLRYNITILKRGEKIVKNIIYKFTKYVLNRISKINFYRDIHSEKIFQIQRKTGG